MESGWENKEKTAQNTNQNKESDSPVFFALEFIMLNQVAQDGEALSVPIHDVGRGHQGLTHLIETSNFGVALVTRLGLPGRDKLGLLVIAMGQRVDIAGFDTLLFDVGTHVGHIA